MIYGIHSDFYEIGRYFRLMILDWINMIRAKMFVDLKARSDRFVTAIILIFDDSWDDTDLRLVLLTMSYSISYIDIGITCKLIFLAFIGFVKMSKDVLTYEVISTSDHEATTQV